MFRILKRGELKKKCKICKTEFAYEKEDIKTKEASYFNTLIDDIRYYDETYVECPLCGDEIKIK